MSPRRRFNSAEALSKYVTETAKGTGSYVAPELDDER